MREQKGITLIALVITIIVMLILVAVTITLAVNGGLFDYAKSAADQTKAEMRNEASIDGEGVSVTDVPAAGNGINSIVDYYKGTTTPASESGTGTDAEG